MESSPQLSRTHSYGEIAQRQPEREPKRIAVTTTKLLAQREPFTKPKRQ